MDEKFQFKKKFGQNFLKNEKVLTRIVDVADIKDESLTIEVGPGSGALTKYLKEKGQVLCYEIDKTLEDILMRNFGEEKNVSIYFGDFLKQDIKEDLKDTYLLVNTTSVGMAPHPEGCIIESADMLPNGLKVADIIYNPKETKLLSYARQRGLDYMNGERMIVYQGACSFKFWTGKDMPIHEVKVALGMEESE